MFGELGITSWLCLMDFVYICRRSVSQQWAWLLERVHGSQRELWQYHGASLHGGQIGWEGEKRKISREERIGRGWQTSIALGFCSCEHNFESQKSTKVARTYNETQLFEVCGFNLKSCWYNGFVWGSASGLDIEANKRTWSERSWHRQPRTRAAKLTSYFTALFCCWASIHCFNILNDQFCSL